jgi:hypothetical protein
MDNAEWLKPGIHVVGIGPAVVGTVGFTWADWTTGKTAHARTMTMSHDDVAAAMVPICLGTARTDPDRAAQLAVIRDESNYQRRDLFMGAVWASRPGAASPDGGNSQARLVSLGVDALPERPVFRAYKG